MSLYPSLEDMQTDQMAQAQLHLIGAHMAESHPSAAPPQPTAPTAPYPSAPPAAGESPYHQMAQGGSAPLSGQLQPIYPSLDDYMGLELAELVTKYQRSVAVPGEAAGHGYELTAPLSSSVVQKSAISHSIRELTLCKNSSGHVGLRAQAVSKGVFVVLVTSGSPAALAGLRFGDQILQINGDLVAGFSMEKVHRLFKNAPKDGIKVSVRDRPFERAVTLHKDSSGTIGFQVNNGKITSLIKDSSAARNGLLTDHYVLEVNGQNVVGLPNQEVKDVFERASSPLTVTIMPASIYEHMMSKVNTGLVKKKMDHSMPEL